MHRRRGQNRTLCPPVSKQINEQIYTLFILSAIFKTASRMCCAIKRSQEVPCAHPLPSLYFLCCDLGQVLYHPRPQTPQ